MQPSRLSLLSVWLVAGTLATPVWAENSVAPTTLTADNYGNVFNGIDGTPSQLTTGSLGTGVGISISATGAVTSVSTLADGLNVPGADTTYGDIVQTATNHEGAAISTNGELVAGDLANDYTSASISATGAASSVSWTNISNTSTDTPGKPTYGDITQTSTSEAGTSISLSGSVTVNNLTGRGASATANVTGASATVSVANLNSAAAMGDITTGTITQSANATGAALSNTASVHVLGDMGPQTSATVNTVGSVTAVSFRLTDN